VAAAFEGLFFGLPSIAVSQRSSPSEFEWEDPRGWDFAALSRFVPRLVERVCERGLPDGTMLNVNAPALPVDEVSGVRVTHLGRRVYRTSLDLVGEQGGRRRYRLLDDDPSHHHEPGSDLTAIAEGAISVTPLHYDATAHAALEALRGFGLEELAPA
jgi:5'-nucleotidase